MIEAPASALSSIVTPAFRVRRRRAIVSAWAGFGMDSYSIYIASTTLLPALVFFQGVNPTAEQTSIFAGMTLASTLLGRPLGGLIFGHFADRLGRKRIGSLTVFGFGTVSLLIACLPGAEQVGAKLAVGLLITLRFIEGIFLGGEYTAATPLALEYAPAGRRGFVGALVQCAASAGPFIVAITMSLVLLVAPNAGLHSPYVQWGWRVPFVLGFVLSVLVAVFLRRKVEDSEVWKIANQSTVKKPSPLREMLKGRSGRAFIQSFAMMTGVFFLINITGSVMPQFLFRNPGFSASDLSHTQMITPIPGILSYIFYGWLSDHIGRKKALSIAATLCLVFYPFAISAIGSGSVGSWARLTLLAVLCNILLVGPLGVLPAYINERFATAVRSSGWGVAYSMAVIIPAFFSYYMIWLGKLVPFVWTAGILVALGSVIILVATACGPKTRGIDLETVGEEIPHVHGGEASVNPQLSGTLVP